MWYDGYARGKARGQTSYIIPAWRKGDRVRHKPSGITGLLVEMQTQAGELWKFRPDGVWEYALDRQLPKSMTVHACDLELQA